MDIEVEWQRLTAPEIRAVAARPDAIAVLPIGSLEQHGPHLPVITDTASASAAAVRAARLVAAEMPVLVLPASGPACRSITCLSAAPSASPSRNCAAY